MYAIINAIFTKKKNASFDLNASNGGSKLTQALIGQNLIVHIINHY
jgi:hypothetical protein